MSAERGDMRELVNAILVQRQERQEAIAGRLADPFALAEAKLAGHEWQCGSECRYAVEVELSSDELPDRAILQREAADERALDRWQAELARGNSVRVPVGCPRWRDPDCESEYTPAALFLRDAGFPRRFAAPLRRRLVRPEQIGAFVVALNDHSR